ncbi:pituitary tumor-transforming 1 interacting protein, isoform CRA_a [Mus musculus]|nr:pituitary tumor-transforming 1 interacting protein, isoform CRA_a [Mus musculus]
MAPANLGLTPHWVMLLGAVLLLLLSGASAQEPPRVGCSEYTNRSCEECLRNVS